MIDMSELDISSTNVGLISFNVVLFGLLMIIFYRLRQFKYKVICPSPYKLYNETYCTLTMDLLKISELHLLSTAVSTVLVIV